jgi:hypothetical protein
LIHYPTTSQRDYLIAFDAVAICITESPLSARITRDPLRSRIALRNAFPEMVIKQIIWVQGEKDARTLTRALPAHLASVEAIESEIRKLSETLHIAITDNKVAIQRAHHAVRALDAALAQAQARGDLAFFNQAYTNYRKHRSRGGRRVIPYRVAFSRLRRALARAAFTPEQSWPDPKSMRESVFGFDKLDKI